MFPTQEPSPASEELAVDIAAGMLAIGPWDFLDFYSTVTALDPAHMVREEDGDVQAG